MIDDQTTSVIINWGDSHFYYQQLISQGPSYLLMKKLAQYSVNIRKRDFDEFQSIDAINKPYENIFAITNSDFYKTDTGLSLNNQWLEETYII
jgi:CRISPR-associated endonuclease/helicase Cas3